MSEFNPADLDIAEETAMRGETIVHQWLATCISEIRRLRHELNNPNYQYASSRIHRQALLYREAEIDKLKKEISEMKTQQQEKKV